MNVDRREVLKTITAATVGLLVPITLANNFKIELIPYFFDDYLKITKGNMSWEVPAKWSFGIRDYNNLCATLEVTEITIHALEFGPTSFETQRVQSLSKSEKKAIYNILAKLRGKHDCCLSK